MKLFSSSSSLFLTPSLSFTILSSVLPGSWPCGSHSLFFRGLNNLFILSIFLEAAENVNGLRLMINRYRWCTACAGSWKNHLRMSPSTMNVRYFCCKYLISQRFDRSTLLVLGHCDFEALKQTKLITLVTHLNWNKYTLPGASTINHMTDSCYCIDIVSRYKLYLSILFMCDARHIPSILPRSFRNKIVYSNKPTNYSENSGLISTNTTRIKLRHNSWTKNFSFLVTFTFYCCARVSARAAQWPAHVKETKHFLQCHKPTSHSLCKSVETEKVESPALIKNQYDSNNAPSC